MKMRPPRSACSRGWSNWIRICRQSTCCFSDTFFAKELAPKKWEQIEKSLLLRICDPIKIKLPVPFIKALSLTENNELAPYKWSPEDLKNRHPSKESVPFKGPCKLIGAIHRVYDSHFVLCCSGWHVQNNVEQNGHTFRDSKTMVTCTTSRAHRNRSMIHRPWPG
jgi:hypothetical protein